MSIIIKGMKMPKNCEECTFHNITDEFFDTVHECEVKKNYIIKTDIHKIPLDCPLVEIPKKHGRLIDENILSSFGYIYGSIKSLIDTIPTIFEAEE